MEILSFLRKVVPSTGFYILDTPNPRGKGFGHHVCESLAEMAARALELDGAGLTVYHALASFKHRSVDGEITDPATGEKKAIKRYRVGDNVKALRSFWLDLDAGEGKDYHDQQDAIVGLGAFLNASGLPKPLVVSSGNGLHCYWCLTEDIGPDQWHTTALRLKSLTFALGLKADPTRTADRASVLRPVGTHHRKAAPKPVTTVCDSAPIAFADFYALVESACAKQKIEAPKPRPVLTDAEQVNAEFSIEQNFPRSDPNQIAERCNQIRLMRDRAGDVSEPHWYSAIGVLCHTVDGEETIHRWSSGYPGYSPDETQRKIIQIKSKSMGPTTCAVMEQRNPAGCLGCPHKEKKTITSPIQLGAIVEKAETPVARFQQEEQTYLLPDPPKPYTRAKDGLYMNDADGIAVKFHEYDLYPYALAYDEDLRHEVVYVRHFLPHDGWKEFTFRAGLVAKPTELISELYDQSVKPLSAKLMEGYVSNYIREIQRKIAMRRLYTSMGWKHDNTQFVLGKRVYESTGKTFDADMVGRLQRSFSGFASKGDLQAWVDATEGLARPGMESHAFTLLTGFAAPLLQVTGLYGALVSLLGESGGGKTTMGFWVNSIYGDYNQLKIAADSTYNFKVARLAGYGNLPMFVDEVSNRPPEEISDLAYLITEGKERGRLKSDASERIVGEWRTILIVSTNQSLVSKLYIVKDKPEAENLRIFEYFVPKDDRNGPYWESMSRFLQENYGLAGEVYVKYLVEHADELREGIDRVAEQLCRGNGALNSERYWTAVISTAIYGGMIAKKLGLIKFDLKPVMRWVIEETKGMRSNLAQSLPDDVGTLCNYLNEFAATRLVVRDDAIGTRHGATENEPKGALFQRLETDTGLLFIDRKHIRIYVTKHHLNYNTFRAALMDRGILVDDDIRKNLGKGTVKFNTGPVACWQIDLKHRALGDFAVDTGEEGRPTMSLSEFLSSRKAD